MKTNMEFKNFLLNEQQIKQDESKKYLGQRIGDVLSSIHDVEENGKAMGNRKVMKNTLQIVNQIRNILHDQWPSFFQPYLEIIQKVGVALAKAVEEKGDAVEILASGAEELENLLAKMGVPINQIGTGIEKVTQ